MTATIVFTVYISGCIFVGMIAGFFSEKFDLENKCFEVFLLTVFWTMCLALGVIWGIIFAPYFIGWRIRRVLKKNKRKEKQNEHLREDA